VGSISSNEFNDWKDSLENGQLYKYFIQEKEAAICDDDHSMAAVKRKLNTASSSSSANSKITDSSDSYS